MTLKDVKEISLSGAPLKDSMFIPSTSIDTWASGPADAKAVNGDCERFRVIRINVNYNCNQLSRPTLISVTSPVPGGSGT